MSRVLFCGVPVRAHLLGLEVENARALVLMLQVCFIEDCETDYVEQLEVCEKVSNEYWASFLQSPKFPEYKREVQDFENCEFLPHVQ